MTKKESQRGLDRTNPLHHIDDGIDLDREQDTISRETEEQNARDGMGVNKNRRSVRVKTKRRSKKVWK